MACGVLGYTLNLLLLSAQRISPDLLLVQPGRECPLSGPHAHFTSKVPFALHIQLYPPMAAARERLYSLARVPLTLEHLQSILVHWKKPHHKYTGWHRRRVLLACPQFPMIELQRSTRAIPLDTADLPNVSE
jgi:hypothetical protein